QIASPAVWMFAFGFCCSQIRIPTEQNVTSKNDVKITEATPVWILFLRISELILCVARIARNNQMTRKMRTNRPILKIGRFGMLAIRSIHPHLRNVSLDSAL